MVFPAGSGIRRTGGQASANITERDRGEIEQKKYSREDSIFVGPIVLESMSPKHIDSK